MPFNGQWQYPNALLVESSNFVLKNTGYTANAGDVVVCNNGTTGQAATFNVTLPPVAQGGPVTVINCNATTVGGTVSVITSDGSLIDGTSSTSGSIPSAYKIAIGGNQITFASDGSNWYRVA